MILATSVVESSVTIANLSYVIDTGITRDSDTADLFGLSVLPDGWSAQAVVQQRMGRVGRTQPGIFLLENRLPSEVSECLYIQSLL